jgi:hypothetical protein
MHLDGRADNFAAQFINIYYHVSAVIFLKGIFFSFWPPCPVECSAYSSGVSRKKNISFLCVLGASAVNY